METARKLICLLQNNKPIEGKKNVASGVETICGLDLAQTFCFTAERATFFLIDLRKIISKARFEPS